MTREAEMEPVSEDKLMETKRDKMLWGFSWGGWWVGREQMECPVEDERAYFEFDFFSKMF